MLRGCPHGSVLTAFDGACLNKLRDWADMLLVAPLSANTLAKLANGLCDNLVVRTYCTQGGDWHTPDVVFVFSGNNLFRRQRRIRIPCRSCCSVRATVGGFGSKDGSKEHC